MVVHERFAIIIPKEYPMQYAGPVMCAGVTLFDPLRRYKATKGTRVAIVGLGGLGQMGVKIAKAMGCVITVVSRSVSKQKFATDCGASSFVCSEDAAQMKAAAKSFDLVLNTIPAHHDYQTYTNLVAKGGKHIILGLNAGLVGGVVLNSITMNQSKVVGSGIGGIEATQAVINLCHENKIFPDIQIVRAEQINEVYEKLDSSNQDGVRYVIDISGNQFSKKSAFH
jgi:D-arabinose 1-dehydrogenase-like Zn-dependent alcohol dehydrogenase